MEDGKPGLTSQNADARAEFVLSLGRRVETLRDALAALRAEPFQRGRRENFLRRTHAMSAAARVLGFPAVADRLTSVEIMLGQTGETTGPEFSEIDDILRGLPRIASGATEEDVAPDSEPEPAWWGPAGGLPLSVLVFGDVALAGAFEPRSGEPNVECACVDDPEKLSELARAIGPDAIVVDGHASGLVEVVARIARDPMIEPVPIVVVGLADPTLEAAALGAGAARVLHKPISDAALRAQVLLLTRPKEPDIEFPLGAITLGTFADWCAEAVREGIAQAARGPVATTMVELGDGHEVMAAIWAAVARVHDIVTRRTDGKVRFDPVGPSGTIAMARWVDPDPRQGSRAFVSSSEPPGVTLEGRTIVVVDDDPAVVWFLAGVLRNAGASVLEAHDGEQALALILAQWPDLVISDVLMPKLDGLSLCREVKQDVAVRDVPVILISWKEDLLQRLRELGADADAYLRKEAESSSVVQRVRLVIRRRARVEQRLASPGEVRGRLDGLSPRLVLELVGRFRPSSCLTVQDAVHRYEVRFRDGALVAASRAGASGTEQGAAVLAGLLGVSSGRFVVRPDSGAVTPEFSGSLRDVLGDAIARARSAQRELKAERLIRVNKVELDRARVTPYLVAAPGVASQLIASLLDGVSPRDLILDGASPLLLEAALQDLARRGAVVSVSAAPTERPPGVAALGANAASGAPGSEVTSSGEQPSTLPPDQYEQVPGEAERAHDGTDPPPAQRSPVFTFDLFSTGPTPEVEPKGEIAGRPSEAGGADGNEWDEMAEELEAVLQGPDEPTRSLVRREAPTLDRISEPMDLAQAVLGLGGSPEPPPIRPSPVIVPTETAEDPSVPSLEVPVRAQAKPPATKLDLPRGRVVTQAGPPATKLDLPRARTKEPSLPDAAPPPARLEEAEQLFDSQEAPSAPDTSLIDDVSDAAFDFEGGSDPPPGQPEPSRPAASRPKPPSEVSATRAASEKSKAPAAPPEVPPVLELTSDAPPRPLAATMKLALATAASFAFMFFGVRYLLTPETPPTEVVLDDDPTLSAAEQPVEVASVAPAAPSAAGPVIQSGLDVTPDAALPGGKGLLEVVTPGRHFVYVDDVFVGRGPKRLVTLDPGSHRVEVRLTGEPRSFSLVVDAGKRTLLTTPE